MECVAVNTEGNDTSEAYLEITDIVVSPNKSNPSLTINTSICCSFLLQTPFHIWGLADDIKIAAGDNVSVICAASVYNHSSDLNWYLNDNLIESDDSMTDL